MMFRLGMLRGKWLKHLHNTRLVHWISICILLSTIAVLVILLIREHEKLRQFDNWRTYLVACEKGFLLYPLSLSAQALVWSRIIRRLGKVDHGWLNIEIYAYSHLMRRLPGAIWYLASRTMMYYGQGIDARITLAASGLEWLLLVVTAGFIYSILYLSNLLKSWWLGFGGLLLLIGGAVWGLKSLYLQKHRRPPNLISYLLDSPVETLPRVREVVLWIGLYSVAYAVGGAILWLLVHGVVVESNIMIIDAIRIWALAGGVSFVTSLIVPAGMGIRELTITALLVPEVSTAEALLIALLLRILFIAGDLIWGGLMWAMARLLRHNLK